MLNFPRPQFKCCSIMSYYITQTSRGKIKIEIKDTFLVHFSMSVGFSVKITSSTLFNSSITEVQWNDEMNV